MLTLLPNHNLANVVDIVPLSPDDLSDVRYIHATAFRLQASAHLPRNSIQAFTDLVYSNDYLKKLAGEDLFAARLGDEIVGTGGWTAVKQNGSMARIKSVFVRPLFTGAGIGFRLVKEAENRARGAGFSDFCVRAPVNAVGFFERLGFKSRSHGVHAISPDHGIPVQFMRKCRKLPQRTTAAEGDAQSKSCAESDATSAIPPTAQ